MYAASPVLHCEIPMLLSRRGNVLRKGQGEEEGYQVWFKNNIGWCGRRQPCRYIIIVSQTASEPEQGKRGPDRMGVPRECVYC